MGETNISKIGNILAVKNVSNSDTDTLKKQCKIEFADAMNLASRNNTRNMMQQAKNNTISAVTEKKTQADVKDSSVGFGKYQYKDCTIQTVNADSNSKNQDIMDKKVNEFAEDVNEVLKSELGVTDEEIQKAMETLGISYLDLMNQGKLALLAATLTDSGSVNQMLCSESFMNVLQEVTMLGQDLLQEMQMSSTELIQAYTAPEVSGADNMEAVLVSGSEAEAEIADSNEILSEVVKGAEENGLSTGNEDSASERITALLGSAGEGTKTESVVSVTGKIQNTETARSESVTQEKQEDGKVITVLEEEPAESSEEELQNQDSDGTTEKSWQAKERTKLPEVSASQPDAFSITHLDEFGNMETIQELPEYVSVRDIIEQFVDSAKVTISGEISKMEMQLNPENLGKIYLEVSQREGAVTAKIQTQNAVVKEALESQMAELKQNLNQAGIKVDSVEVTVASHEFERNLEQDARRQEQQAEENAKAAKRRGIHINSLDELSGLMSEEELLMARIMVEQGNSMDVTV